MGRRLAHSLILFRRLTRPLILFHAITVATMAGLAQAGAPHDVSSSARHEEAGRAGACRMGSTWVSNETTSVHDDDAGAVAAAGDTGSSEAVSKPPSTAPAEPADEPGSPADDADRGWLDRAAEALRFETRGGTVRAQIGGRLDLEEYFIDQLPPGLIVADEGFFFQPRLTVLFDLQLGRRIVGFVEATADRGFDPGLEPDGDARIDQYLLRYTPTDAGVVNLQAGKFATLFGGWAPRRDAWENPLINAPLPYENVTTISDTTVPPSPAAFLARRERPDDKETWLPMIWGPSDASGAAVFGRAGAFEYAAEVKNASLASRPEYWGAGNGGWSEPTLTARVGWRPSTPWRLGLSFSRGTYLRPPADEALQGGTDREDFPQTIAATDLTFAGRRVELWAEALASRFEVPNVGDAETWAWFLEMKWRIDARWFLAGRWNQQRFGEVPDGMGGDSRWDNDAWRADAALGLRFDRHVQGKVQYGYSHQQGQLQQGEQFAAVQLSIKL